VKVWSRWKSAVFAFGCIACLFALVATSKSFQDCEQERKSHKAYQALHERAPLFIKSVVHWITFFTPSLAQRLPCEAQACWDGVKKRVELSRGPPAQAMGFASAPLSQVGRR